MRPVGKGSGGKGIVLANAIKGTVTGSGHYPVPIINLVLHRTDISKDICCCPGEGRGIVVGGVGGQCRYGYRWWRDVRSSKAP